MKGIILDRIKDSALYAGTLTMINTVALAALWWHIPGKTVLFSVILVDVALTIIIYALLWGIERIAVRACGVKRTTRRGYVSRDVVKAVSREEKAK